jgi:hypothetical protein
MSNTNKERYGDGIYQRDGLSANLEHRVTHTQQKISPRNGHFYSFYVGVALEIGGCEKQIAAWNISELGTLAD